MSVSVSSDLADAKVLVGTVKAPLMAGVYRVQWRAVSRDTHRTTGAFTFKVR
ncbi:MAG TPA: copper resistance protein CopC [Caulobacteraceae bacterium]